MVRRGRAWLGRHGRVRRGEVRYGGAGPGKAGLW